MVTDRRAVDVEAVRRAVEDVPDPELPPVTIGMLGMVYDLTVDRGDVRVELLPTFSGCPATEWIERDVVAAASTVDGVEQVRVRFRYDPPWTPDRIDTQGRERLREFGIAPPGQPLAGAVHAEDRRSLPLVVGDVPGGDARDGSDDHRPCPYCGADDTRRESSFGPTPCRDLRWCGACQQPFEAFKRL